MTSGGRPESAREHVAARLAAGATAAELDAWLSARLDETVREAAEEACPRPWPERWTLVALGGYGDERVCLRSDVDLQLLTEGDAAGAEEAMAALSRALRTRGQKPALAARDAAATLELATSELTIATAWLTARPLIGPPERARSLATALRDELSGPRRAWFARELAADRERRASRYGDTVNVLEPELKHGLGGLRDGQVTTWLVAVGAEPAVPEGLAAAIGDLRRVRHALHLEAAFKTDRLTFEYQEAVAVRLELAGPHPAQKLMRTVHLALRTVARLAARSLARANRPPGEAPPSPRALDRATTVTLLATVADHDEDVDPELEERIEAFAASAGDLSEDGDLQDLVLHLLLDVRPGTSRALHLAHRTGLLAAVMPELSAIAGLSQRDLYHVYTVDEHSLRAVDRLKALARGDLASELPRATDVMRRLGQRRVLMLATLLHDAGKGQGGRHHVAGARMTEEAGLRLGLPRDQARRARLLVRHQADLMLVAQRRDLADPRPLRALARITGDQRTLDELYLLTVADAGSVGPGAFTGWHRSLLDTLHERVSHELSEAGPWSDPGHVVTAHREALVKALLGEVPDAPSARTDPVDDFCAALPTRYFQAFAPGRAVAHFKAWQARVAGDPPTVEVAPRGEDVVEVVVLADDRPGLLADVTGALAAAGANVLSAHIFSVGAVVLDIFHVADPHGRYAADRGRLALADSVSRGLAAPASIAARLAERASSRLVPEGLPAPPTRVAASNDLASAHTVVDVTAEDRPGLLNTLASALHGLGVSVDMAFVSTEGRTAHDSFYLTQAGRPLEEAARTSLVGALEAALGRGSR